LFLITNENETQCQNHLHKNNIIVGCCHATISKKKYTKKTQPKSNGLLHGALLNKLHQISFQYISCVPTYKNILENIERGK